MPARLKSLELHGYKTFASRTLFEFADKVTAIVGPNGSGKSNVADSLRWVLGEQSYTLLRGKKTEDMIFAGSEMRPRAGMASATITFDNFDGWLPIDFSEVAITRRAYRDGQNEYLINGQKVRLKDVSELLAQSGLAERTYTIIGQGLVDAALALKAEERRRLFEEAAGIGLHRTRREEALTRLETTKRNLERVLDILAELQPRLKSLERQARRAQEYAQVKADLQVVLREWYGYHWHRAQRELAEGREAAKVQEVLLEKARQEQQALDAQLSALRDRSQNLRASMNSWHRQSALLHSRREELSKELAVADERLRSLGEQRQAAEADRSRLQEELTLAQERQEAARVEVERLNTELQEARTQVETARKAFSARQAERARVDKDLQSARQSLSGLNNRQSQAQARLSERKAQAERSQRDLRAADEAVAAAETERQTAEGKLRKAEMSLRQADADLRAANEGFQLQRQELKAAEGARKGIQDERAMAATELARRRAQLEVLDGAEKALTGYAGGTRLLLQAARQAKLNGARGALSSHLEVPANLEKAITAALGEYLDAVLLEGDSAPALDLLGREALRGVLLPLRNLKPAAPLDCHGEGLGGEGFLGVAADLVQAPPDLRPTVDLLLGWVVVVDDRPAAQRALAALNQDERLTGLAKVVTLKGEVFFAAGPVLSSGNGTAENGKGKNEAASSVLSRARQRRELAEAVTESEKTLAKMDQHLKNLDQELKDLQAESDDLSQAQRMARSAQEKASLAVNSARLAVEQAVRQAKWQADQRARLQSEISRGEAEAANLASELEKLEAEITKGRERVRECSRALETLALDEFQAQVAHWNTQSAVAERALEDGKNRLRERQSAVERSQRACAALENRLKELAAAAQKMEGDKVNQRQLEGQLAQEIEALRVLTEPAEAELEKVEAEQASMQAAEAAARQSLSNADHHNAQARINLTRRQEALDNLRHKVEEDFGLVAFDYNEDVSGPMALPLEGMVEQLPRVDQLASEVEETIKRQRAQLRRMGPVNPEAQTEYLEVKTRFEFLTEQVADLQKAEEGVRQVIAELDGLMQREFRRTFELVAAEFKLIFTRLFGGGTARLLLTEPENLTDTGIDIEARLPGRRTQGLSLLSGGERSLTAVALVFSLLKVSPTPFCVLDEVDAMLDEANVGRYRDLLGELGQNTQFIVVTHNRNTVQVADVIYGVTMGRDSASQVISLRLDEVAKIVEDRG